MGIYENAKESANYIKSRLPQGFAPQIALVLGSGLGGFAEKMEVAAAIKYADIPHFPLSTVMGHSGNLVVGTLFGKQVLCMQGRFHYYEGYSMEDVVLPIRLMGLLGAQVLFLTNGVGAVNRSYRPGDLMLMRDHLSLFIPSPLLGENMDELGPRFPDMTHVYREDLCDAIRRAAAELRIRLQDGVYVQLTGPQYETPEEIRVLEKLGGDVVGMSTVCEAIAANHMGLRVCGVSAIGNMGAGIRDEVLTHEPKDEVDQNFADLVTASIRNISQLLS